MSSFIEKLKKGMGVEVIPEQEITKSKESSSSLKKGKTNLEKRSGKKENKRQEKAQKPALLKSRQAKKEKEKIEKPKKISIAKSFKAKKKMEIKRETDKIKKTKQKITRKIEIKKELVSFKSHNKTNPDLLNETKTNNFTSTKDTTNKLSADSANAIKNNSSLQGSNNKNNSASFSQVSINEKEKNEERWSGPEGELTVDVYQTDKDLVIQSAIAGVTPEDIDISIENDMLIIRGYRKNPTEKEEKNYFFQECYWGAFLKEIVLPEEVDNSRIQASLKNGILTIRIPKIERKRKRKIVIE